MGAAEPGADTVSANDSAAFVPRERCGQNGGGWRGGGPRSAAVLSPQFLGFRGATGRAGSDGVNQEAPCWLVL